MSLRCGLQKKNFGKGKREKAINWISESPVVSQFENN